MKVQLSFTCIWKWPVLLVLMGIFFLSHSNPATCREHSALPTFKNMDTSKTYYREKLNLLCKQHGMTLPRPLTAGQLEELRADMKEHSHKHIITDATSTSYWLDIDKGHTIRYPVRTLPLLSIKHYKEQQTGK